MKSSISSKRLMQYILVPLDGRFGNFKSTLTDDIIPTLEVFSMTSYCDEFNVDNLIHTFASTSNFKCCCDACGADTKRWYRKAEMDEKDRCSDALQCYLLLANHMPQPRQSRENLMMKLHGRHHRIVCTTADEKMTRKKLTDDFEGGTSDKRNDIIFTS